MKKILAPIILSCIVLQSCAILGTTGGSNSANSAYNTIKIIQAAQAAAVAFTISDEQIAALSRESVIQMDRQNRIADANSKYTIRLNKLTSKIKDINGLKPNFKVYLTKDINAFACADGSIRVYSALMDIMDDDELMGIIGHEMGHIANKDSKDALKHAYLAYAAIQAIGSTGGKIAQLTNTQLSDIAQAFIGAKYSQKQEYEADEYGFNTCVRYGFSPYGMANSLTKLVKLSNGPKASALQQMFSSHPDSAKRAEKMMVKADNYAKSKK